jgi:hypothetical protein
MPVEPEPVRHVTPDRDPHSAINRVSVRLQNAMSLAAMALCAIWSVAQVAGSAPATRVLPNGVHSEVSVATAAPAPAAGVASDLQTEPTSGASEAVDARPVASSAPISSNDRSSDGAGRPRHRPEPSEPLPSVDGIMISGDRRLAIVGGEVVAAGDVVGIRAVARIEHDGVVLKEPSGREIYVAMRPRRPPTLGS